MTDAQVYFEDVETGDAIPALTVTVDETQMFFFSAATYNGHRIHYDKEWARDSEGYDDVLVQGPLQAALLVACAHRLDRRRRAAGGVLGAEPRDRLPGQELTFGGVVTGEARRRADWSTSTSSGKRGDDVLMPGTATVALPQRGDAVTGLRGEAAIVGIAELPAETQAERPAVVHPRPVRAAGEDGDRGRRRGSRCGQRACRRTASPSRTCSRRPRCPSTSGLPLDFGERVDLGGATVGGHGVAGRRGGRTGSCATRCSPSCRARPRLPRSEREARAHAQLVRRVEQQVRLAAGRVRDPVRQRRAERPVRPDRPALRRASSATTPRRWRKIAVDQRTNACAHPGAVFHGKPITVDDVLASPMIADPIHMLETVMRVQGGAGVLIANADVARRARHRPVWIKGFGEHICVQDTDLRRRPDAHPDRARRRTGVRDGGAARGPTSTWRRSTTATRSPC